MENNSAGNNHPRLPPGFRFHPTDEELVVHYLKKRAASAPLPVAIIAELDLYKYDPWELPSKASFGEQEWYFFSRRERKYPNGERPNRAATSGYWKATGTDKPILTANGAQTVGVKKALVFYGGKPPKGIKSNWIMHEYRLVDGNSAAKKTPGIAFIGNKTSSRLDDWVLCRIFKKSNSGTTRPVEEPMQSSPINNGYHNSIPGMPSGNGFEIPGNPMRSDNFPEDISLSSQYWNGMVIQPAAGNNGKAFPTSNNDEDDNMNPSSCSQISDEDQHGNLSFISLLNNYQQFPQTFQQNSSLVDSHGEGNGILDQSCQLPTSYF
ncbi:hypothetical protein ACP275_13G157100 [Erythranthe tilingii]